MGHDDLPVAKYLKRHQALFGDQLNVGPTGKTAVMEIPLEQSVSTGESDGHPLHAFCAEISQCQKCALGATRNKFVFGVGNPDADLVFVGEAPGAREDEIGEPFVGRAGKLLDDILKAIDLSRKDVFILNVLKCRPPGNRNPSLSEVEQCEPYLKEQLRILNPKLIVTLGLVAAKTLLRQDDTLQNMRAKIFEYAGIEARVTYHPAALLRNPRLKAPAWEDFQAIRDRYHELRAEG